MRNATHEGQTTEAAVRYLAAKSAYSSFVSVTSRTQSNLLHCRCPIIILVGAKIVPPCSSFRLGSYITRPHTGPGLRSTAEESRAKNRTALHKILPSPARTLREQTTLEKGPHLGIQVWIQRKPAILCGSLTNMNPPRRSIALAAPCIAASYRLRHHKKRSACGRQKLRGRSRLADYTKPR